jgi:arylsulfatase
MHIWTHLKEESQGKTGLGIYPDGMVEHDGHIGQLLKLLDDLGIADNTIVIWTTDNGAEAMSWPDGGTTPFRGEKNTNWEGGYRVPLVVRWPGTVTPGSVYNDIMSHEDFLPTLMAAAGQPDIKANLLKGAKVGGKTYKVHLDGYDWGPYFRGESKAGPRREFFYWTDDGDVAGLRYDQYKLVFMEQRAHGYEVWQDPMVTLRLPKLFNLRTDPFERADHEGIDYPKWRLERAYLLVPAQAIVGDFLKTLQEYPPRQKPGSFSLGDAMEKIQTGAKGGSN